MEALQKYSSLRTFVRDSFSPTTQELVDKALLFAAERMGAYTRYDGAPMMDHDVAVAEIVAREIGLGRNSTVASILHDVMRIAVKEDPDGVDELTRLIRAEFGDQVIGIIVGLCKISNIKLKVSKEQADDFRDMIVSYSEDPRVILIKLADRLEVMRSLQMFPPDKRRKKSWESMNLYAQIAHKLGLYNLKSELEDLALKWLEPRDYEYICRRLEETESERRTFIARFLQPITDKIDRHGIRYHIKSRTKSIYSIWNKMRKQNVPFEGVYDIFALRIIVDCEREMEKQICWTIYSIVSDCYTPNPDRMRENYPYRIMEARWRNSADGAFRATIAISARDTAGLANRITEVITRELKLNIRGINFVSRGDGTARGTVSVEVPSSGVVDTLIHSVMKIKGVQKAYRVNS